MRVTSFRMVDGRVRNLSAHFDRLGLTSSQRRDVRAMLIDAPPACNPLITEDAGVVIRPDRPFSALINVDPSPHEDFRAQPTTKGPDLEWLATRLQLSRQRGYDEGMLSFDRRIVEAVFSAIICFDERDDGVVSYSVHSRALRSTTLPSVLEYLQARGIRVRPVNGFREPKQMWLVNAFSGVRSAGGPDPTAVNSWLWEQAELV